MTKAETSILHKALLPELCDALKNPDHWRKIDFEVFREVWLPDLEDLNFARQAVVVSEVNQSSLLTANKLNVYLEPDFLQKYKAHIGVMRNKQYITEITLSNIGKTSLLGLEILGQENGLAKNIWTDECVHVINFQIAGTSEEHPIPVIYENKKREIYLTTIASRQLQEIQEK